MGRYFLLSILIPTASLFAVASPVIFTTLGAGLATAISLTLVGVGNDPWQNGSEGLGEIASQLSYVEAEHQI